MGMLVLLPVLLAGFPYALPGQVSLAREFLATGLVHDSRLYPEALSLFHPFIAWDDVTAWTAVSAGFFMAALFPWWIAARRLFDARVAWISTVILAFLPMYWNEMLENSGYSLALFFLFSGFAALAVLHERRRVLAMVLGGLCFGAVVASRDAFLTIFPWFVVGYLWHWRGQFRRSLALVALCGACAYVTYALPSLPNALAPGLSAADRVATILPSFAHATPGANHLYPDDYTYEFLRDEYDARMKADLEKASFIERQENQNYRIIFGAVSTDVFSSFFNGFWLLLNVLPSLAATELVGGIFLWIFIVPGIAAVRRKRSWLPLQVLGVWLSMEFLLRFVLHFGRTHVNDLGWTLALFAAAGISSIVSLLPKNRAAQASVIATILCAVQLLQADRAFLAEKYSRSLVPWTYAATAELAKLPSDTVVAHPNNAELLYFSTLRSVSVHADTVAYLLEKGRLADPFTHYGVDAIIGYDPEQARAIKQAVPGITVIALPEHPPSVPLTPLTRLLLNAFR